MDPKAQTKSPGFMGFIAVVVALLLAAYVVFICLKMARTPGSRETLLALAVALVVGMAAAGLGVVGFGRKR